MACPWPPPDEEDPVTKRRFLPHLTEPRTGDLDPRLEPLRVSLKCDPERVETLREAHPAIQPPRYFDRRHWNQVTLDGSLDDALVGELIDHSYALVVQGLPKKVRDTLP